MKAKDVLNLLQVTRVTLFKYVKSGKLKVTQLPNGYYDYDDNSVFEFLGKNNRSNVIYARVSTPKQKPDLANQIAFLSSFAKSNKISIASTFSDIHSGLDLNRLDFNKLLQDVFNYKIGCIVISYKDRLTRLSFQVLEFIFKFFGTSIVIANRSDSSHDEYFDDILTLMHSLSTKFYAKRTNIYKNSIDDNKKDELDNNEILPIKYKKKNVVKNVSNKINKAKKIKNKTT
jgi:predicted site-specific integrase-resolvase